MKEDGEGVTSSSSEPLPTSSGQMGVPILTERLTKMITDVQDGPLASGEGRAVDKLTIQDLRDIRDAADKLKITKNPAVKAACGSLDDQEGRGWLGADLLGVTLVHSYEAPTEGHKVGQQIDDILSDAKKQVERLKGAARKRKTDARKKGLGAAELAGQLRSIDEKLAADLSAYARTLVDIELPKGVVEVKRERPPPPPPVPVETVSQRRTKVEKAEEAAACADADEVAARRRYDKSEAAAKIISDRRLENSSGGWCLEDEAYEQLLAARVVDDREHEQASALSGQLLGEWMAARSAALEARIAADEARADATSEQRWAALELTWKQCNAEREAAREAAREAERAAEAAAEQELRAHEDEALEAFKQELAQRRREEYPTYALRGDPSTWQLPVPS